VSRRVFITGTDTGVGKTWLTCRAVRALQDAGQRAIALKPVACGADANGQFEDLEALLRAQPGQCIEAINRYRFALPAAPAAAASAAGERISPEELVSWCARASQEHDISLIEGVGGLMVPLTDRYTVLDWLADMPDCEVWLVADCRLGGINHTLLSCRALEQIGRRPAHIFVNAPAAGDEGRQPGLIAAIRPLVEDTTKIHSLSHGANSGLASLLLH